MPRTIQCNHCGVVLNLPDHAAGKKLKCPKCGTKFAVGSDTAQYPSTERSDHDASPDSSQELPRSTSRAAAGHGDQSLPTSSGDLRDTFDLPMMTEASSAHPAKSQARKADALALFEDEKKPAPRRAAAEASASKSQVADALALFEDEKKPAPRRAAAEASASKSQVADALALFEDEKKPAPRRPSAAEARSKARRCPTCGGNVPAGMSICSTCGLDLESGTRVAFDDDLMPEAPPAPQGPPLPVTIIALISLLGSIILTILSVVQWSKGAAGWHYFIPICLFGAFAAVQLLRGHTAKLLLVALSLGAMVDIVALIAMPVFQANEETTIVAQAPNNDPDAEDVAIQPISERLDTQRMSLGIAILMTYAAVSVYLVSPPVRRYYAKR